MLNPIWSIKRFINPYLLVFLFAFDPCFAQITKVNELLPRLKQTMPDTARLSLLKQLSTAYSSVDPEKKFYYANVYKSLAQKLNNHEAVADSYVQMGISYGIRSKIDSALFYFNVGYNHAKKYGFELTAGRALANIGFAYNRLDDNREAITNYFQALAIYKKIGYELGANQCYTNIGAIYYDMDKNEIARSYFKQALAGYTKSKNDMGIASALYSVGNCYLADHQDEQAIEYYNRSLAIRQKLGDLNGIGLTRMGLGRAYTHQKKYTAALTSLDSALKNMRTLGDKYVEANVLNSIADVYNDSKDYGKAIEYGTQALNISRAIKAKGVGNESMDKLVTAYKNKGDLKNAFYYQTQYLLSKDSMQEEKMLKDITLIEMNRVRSENAGLEKNNQDIAAKNSDYLDKINKYSTVIIATSIVLASAILLLGVLYRRNQTKQATNKLLVKQKEEIAAINNELAMLNEEINAQMELSTAQNIELERLNDVKNKFFSIVSHDLRSPLSTLQTLLAVYREGDMDEKELGDLLVKLEDTILSTGTFLDNLLEWSKNQLEGMKINPVDVDIRSTIDENIHLFETKIGLKNLRVSNAAKADTMAFADQDMINLVIRNLLSNSIKFCKASDSIVFNAEVNGNRTIISISDTGPGISRDEADKLFSLEHTLSTGTQGEKGNHLGLILCKDMITQNKGNIWFETEPGKGTTFWFDLPNRK
ncbi:tetratricopeptide repeat protein [Mucilaginibacter sp. AK015]|uniref:tetratricopeptide repeat protein n=1 Tax=Mucilaginibacter sp. AK015 TaxID=2723072 RepID=UPI0016205A06|nr:tetratricopeptide repeat protein [Mucilaginibacter sp. AK015]MBB5395407.1 signal transduction histidine kinase [Mucilaginibacter sp. AK015]